MLGAVVWNSLALWRWWSERPSPPVPRDPMERKCAGTRQRNAYQYATEELTAKWDTYDKTHHVPADAGVAGCGAAVTITPVRATKPKDGGRATFARSIDVVICPHCDKGAA